MCMSTTFVPKTTKPGGFRPGSGRKLGSGTHTKICISVTRKAWKTALSKWKTDKARVEDRSPRKVKRSRFVDWLILAYISGGVTAPRMEAI